MLKLQLCPFAAEPWQAGAVQIRECAAQEYAELLNALLSDAERLDTHAELETTLLVYSRSLMEFQEFLLFIADSERRLRQGGYSGVYQLASFHPQYRFAETNEQARENYSNRSPFPTLQLLREQRVGEALQHHPSPERIYQRNILRLRAMSDAEIRKHFPYLQ